MSSETLCFVVLGPVEPSGGGGGSTLACMRMHLFVHGDLSVVCCI